MSKGDDARTTTSRQVRGSSILLAGRLTSKVVNFAVQVGVVRLLSKDDFGVFAYGLALALAGELVVKFGLGRGANRFVPYHAERGEPALVMGILGLVCAVIVGLGVVGFAALWAIAELGLAGFPTGEGGRVVLVLAVLAPVQALDTIGIQTLACFSRPRDILIRKHLFAPAMRAGAVGLVYFAGGDVMDLALAYLGGALLGLAICFQMAHRQLRAHGILPRPISTWRVPWGPLLRFSLPLMSSDLVFIAMTGVTTVVVMWFEAEQGVAEMRAVVPAAALIGLVVQSFSMLYLPSAMRLHARGDDAGMQDHHWQSVAWVTVLSFPLFGLTFAIAPAFVPVLLGEAYAESARLLAILAVGHYASVCMAFNGDVMQVFARTRAIVGTDALTIATSVLLALLLCPPLGAVGAAIAVTAARLVGALARQLILIRTPAMGRVPRAQKWLWGKLLLATLAATALGWAWQPPFPVQVALLGLVSVALLRSAASTLDLERSFPELRRIPYFSRLVGVRVP